MNITNEQLMTIGAQVGWWRKKRNVSKAELERLTGLSRSEIHKIESGERPTPKTETLNKICEALNLEYDPILLREKSK